MPHRSSAWNEPRLVRVYKIDAIDLSDFYIGSTKMTLSKRMGKHREDCRNGAPWRIHEWMREIGIQNARISLLETHTCNSFEEQAAKEQDVIDRFRPTLNTQRAYTSNEEHARRAAERYQSVKGTIVRTDEQKQKDRDRCRERYANDPDYKQHKLDACKEYRERHAEVVKKRKADFYAIPKNKEQKKKRDREYQQENKEVLQLID